MRRRLHSACMIVLALSVAVLVVPIVLAAAHTITYTAGQDTLIQNRIVTEYNAQKCIAFQRPVGCNSSQLVASGCVVRDICDVLALPPAGAACTTVDGMNVENCTIFTINAAGQDAMMTERLNRDYVELYLQSVARGKTSFATAFAAATSTQQQNSCTAIGLPASCDGP